MQKLLIVLLTILSINPSLIKAYSEYIIAGGQSVGIELELGGILVAGTYKVNGVDIASNSGIKAGDKIIKINDNKIETVSQMIAIIKNSQSKLDITYERNKKVFNTTLNLVLDNNTYKTGLYIKDSVIGIGTLSYIDPNTKIFGALGHEITDSNIKGIIDITGGKIFETEVTSINKSTNGVPGEKNAKYKSSTNNGEINENTRHGIFGIFNATTKTNKLYKVAEPNEIKLGSATMLTVLNGNKISSYDIRIIKLDKNDTTKNILFEITDPKLLSLTGGIVQGMSGSPIIQGNNIVGAVTHVVVESPTKGYGIFITNMLKEGEN